MGTSLDCTLMRYITLTVLQYNASMENELELTTVILYISIVTNLAAVICCLCNFMVITVLFATYIAPHTSCNCSSHHASSLLLSTEFVLACKDGLFPVCVLS